MSRHFRAFSTTSTVPYCEDPACVNRFDGAHEDATTLCPACMHEEHIMQHTGADPDMSCKECRGLFADERSAASTATKSGIVFANALTHRQYAAMCKLAADRLATPIGQLGWELYDKLHASVKSDR